MNSNGDDHHFDIEDDVDFEVDTSSNISYSHDPNNEQSNTNSEELPDYVLNVDQDDEEMLVKQETPSTSTNENDSVVKPSKYSLRSQSIREVVNSPNSRISKMKRLKVYPAHVLFTEENLQGDPKLYVQAGRKPARNLAERKIANELEKSDPPPTLSSSIESSGLNVSNPNMRSLFRVMSESALKKASVGLSGTPGEEVIEETEEEHVTDDEGEGVDVAIAGELIECTGEMLEEIIEEEIIEEEEIIDDEEHHIELKSMRDAGRQQQNVYESSVVQNESNSLLEGDVPELHRQEEEVVEMEDDMDTTIRAPELEGCERLQLQNNFREWPMYWDRPVDFQEACDILTGCRPVPRTKICTSVPQGFRGEGSFVVDLSTFMNRHDVGLDGSGSWGKPTGRTRFYAADANGKPFRVDDGKGKAPVGVTYMWKCMSKRYEHPATVEVHNGRDRYIRKIFTALHSPERASAVGLAVVVYEWIGSPFEFKFKVAASRFRPNVIAPPADGSRTWEAASFNNQLDVLPNTCQVYVDDCPLYAVGAVDFGTAACVILGGTRIDPSKICCRVPQGYREAGTFIIDIRSFLSDAELRRDSNGGWGKPAGNSRYYKIDTATGDAVRVDRYGKLIDGADYDIQILSKRYEHTAVNGRFVRKIYTGRSPSGDRFYHSCSHLAVVTYFWKGEAEWFEATPQNKVRTSHTGEHRMGQLRKFEEPNGERVDEADENALYGEEDHDAPSTSHQHAMREDTITQRNQSPVDCLSTLSAPSHHSLHSHRLGPSPAKRTRTVNGAGTSSQSHSNGPQIDFVNQDLDSIRATIYKREFENQERFSHILDRAESFLERLERASDQGFNEQIWLQSSVGNQIVRGEETLIMQDNGEQGDFPTEEYILQ